MNCQMVKEEYKKSSDRNRGDFFESYGQGQGLGYDPTEYLELNSQNSYHSDSIKKSKIGIRTEVKQKFALDKRSKIDVNLKSGQKITMPGLKITVTEKK